MASVAHLRAWWASRQGLTPASAPKTIQTCVNQAGWLPTSGAPTAYLSVRARMPSISRDAVDRFAIDDAHAIEVPGLSGRPHLLVPTADVPTILGYCALSFRAQLAATFVKDGVTESAFRSVSAQVISALGECPLSPSDLRSAVTHRDAGVLLRIALNDLMLRGIVRRFSANGRIDSVDYRYELRYPDDRPDLENDAAAAAGKYVEHFLLHQGPVTIDEIAAWSDLPKGRTRQTLQSIGAESVAVDGWTDEAWLRAKDAAKWKSFKPDADERVMFLPYRDPFVRARRTPRLLTGATRVRVLESRYDKQVSADLEAVKDLDHHTIACGNEIVGIWEYDPKTKTVVTRLWKSAARLRRLVADAAEDTAVFIREELGDAKLSAVDPPERRAKRLAFCRAS